VGYRGEIKGETSKFWGGFILSKLCKSNDLSKKNIKKCPKTVRIMTKNCKKFDKILSKC
jgi:hypothetical protein